MRVRVFVFGAMIAAGSALWGNLAKADGYVGRGAYGPEPFASWTGFYIGAHAGGAWSDVDWANVSLTGEQVTNDTGGFIGGGQVGYNMQFGAAVVGVEATISGTTLSDTFRSAVNPTEVTYSTDVNTIATVTGRLGYAGNKWLLYAKGGWAGGEVDISGRDSALPDAFSINEWRNGWTVGAGLDYKFAHNISLGVEYSFIDLGSRDFTGVTNTGIPFAITNHDVQIQAVTARLNYQFYRDEYRPLK